MAKTDFPDRMNDKPARMPRTKLSDDDVREIRRLLRESNKTVRMLSRQFSVQERTIRDIRDGVAYYAVDANTEEGTWLDEDAVLKTVGAQVLGGSSPPPSTNNTEGS